MCLTDQVDRAGAVRWDGPTSAHVIPFAVWMLLLVGLPWLARPAPWQYGARSAACLVSLLVLRPWRFYSRPRGGDVAWAVGVGLAVFVVWVVPEVRLGGEPGMLRTAYLHFGVFPLGRAPRGGAVSYDPAVCGWGWTLVRLLGSALVIAVAEEFFWRGFVYRWLQRRAFLTLPLGRFDREAFLLTVVAFGLEHPRWLAGMVAGAAYGALAIRRRSLFAACLAHVITNAVLGVFVILSGHDAFW